MRTENLLHSFNEMIKISGSIKGCFCSFVAQSLYLRRKIQNQIFKIFFAVTHFKHCMSDPCPSCFLRRLYITPFLSMWSSHLKAPCFKTHSHSFPILRRAQKGCEAHNTIPRGSSQAKPLPEKAAGCQQQPLAILRLVNSSGPALCSASTSPGSFTCLSPTRMAALETGPGDAPDGHLLYFWHTTHVLNKWEAECCTKQKPVRGCRLSQANSYATGKKTELGRDLKVHFPEAKESWNSAPFNIKEHFVEHMKEY